MGCVPEQCLLYQIPLLREGGELGGIQSSVSLRPQQGMRRGFREVSG